MNNIDGIININKPAGWTSQDVCAKLRGRLHIKKAGHTGTLDPMATGVLPVCIGKATRIIEYYDRDMKSYHAAMRLGVTTDTLDSTGETLSETPVRIAGAADAAANGFCEEFCEDNGAVVIGVDEIRRAFADYTGKVAQIPPRYSALKVNGRRAYDLARDGREFELRAREVLIESNTVSRIDPGQGMVEFDVVCSKGTYIRTICDDIGRALGCGAVMTALERTGSGYFRIEDAVDLAGLLEMSDDEIGAHVTAMDETLVNLGRVELDARRVKAFVNGNPSAAWSWKVTADTAFDDLYRVYDAGSGSFVGIGRAGHDELVPVKVIV